MSTLTRFWNRLSTPWKWRSLFGGLALLLVIAYQFNIGKTIALVRYHGQLQHRSDSLQAVISALPPAAAMPADTLTAGSDAVSGTEELMSAIANQSRTYGVLLSEIAQSHSETDSSYIIQTDRLVFRGPYYNVLRLLHALETVPPRRVLSAASWELSRNPKTNQWELKTTVYLKHALHETDL